MDWERILLVFTDILLPLAVGYLLKIHNLMPQKACDWLIRFNVVVMVTVLTLMSFWVLPLSAQLLWLRFVIVPVLFYLLFKLLFTDQVLLGSLLLMAATPAAINSVITAQLYKLNVDITIASFLLTTVVFVLVVFPLFFFYIHFGGRL